MSERDNKGKFLPGNQIGRSGRPKGAVSLKNSLQKNLTEADADDIARQVIKRAKRGESKALKLLFEYIDGKPIAQSVRANVNILALLEQASGLPDPLDKARQIELESPIEIDAPDSKSVS